MNAAQLLREPRVGELEHVLRVHLARVREVEAPEEDRVVHDRHLRVHVVVHRARRVRRRHLSRERRARQHRPQQRALRRRDSGLFLVLVPLIENFGDLGRVHNPRKVDLSGGGDLRERVRTGRS